MGTETALSTDTANAFDPNKIAAEVTTAVLIEAAKSGWKKVKKFFQDQDVKDSIDYGDAYSDYLQNTINKNSKIKTLIYRRVPKDLYDLEIHSLSAGKREQEVHLQGCQRRSQSP